MDLIVIDLVKKTVPEHLYKEVDKIFASTKKCEGQHITVGEFGYKRKYSHEGEQEKDVESRMTALAIAKVIMQLLVIKNVYSC